MTTIYGDMRIREGHSTYAPVMYSAPANTVVSGDELWTAPADGDQVKAGDKWLRITYAGYTGWMAYIHLGKPYCKDFTDATPPPPTPDPSGATFIVDVLIGDEVIFHHEAPQGTKLGIYVQ